MKKPLLTFAGLIFFALVGQAQSQIPEVYLTKMERDTAQLRLDKKYNILSLFSPDCKPCISWLRALSENMERWENAYGNVSAMGVASKSMAPYFDKVKRFSNKQNFPFPLYIDHRDAIAQWLYNKADVVKENNFHETQGRIIISKPQIFILDADGNVLWQRRGFRGEESIREIEEILKR